MAKIGWLFLKKGRWGQRQIISEKWIVASTQKQVNSDLRDGYGYQWWIFPGNYYGAVGNMGQYIFVVPSKNLVTVFTGHLKGIDFNEPVMMMDRFILPAISTNGPLPANKIQTMKLNALVKQSAEPQAYTWRSKKEGLALDGVFRREAKPAFSFSYPVGSRKKALNPRFSNQIMALETLDDSIIFAFVARLPSHIRLANFGPDYYAPIMESYPIFSDTTIVSNKPMVLKDGTPAYRIDIDYKWKILPLRDVVIVARKHKRFVYVTTSGMQDAGFEERVQSLESLIFEGD